MAKKRKKFVASIASKKAGALVLKQKLRNVVMVFTSKNTNKHCDLYTRQGELFKVSKATALSLDALRFKWHVTLWVACKPEHGDKYISQAIVNTSVEYTRNQLSQYTAEKFDALKASQNPKHVVSHGWIASIEGADLSDDELNNFITQHDGWN